MKRKHVMILAALGVAGALCILWFIPHVREGSEHAELNHAFSVFNGLTFERIVSAVSAYDRAQKAKGGKVSDTVTLRELVAGGFLRAEEAAPFGNSRVEFKVRAYEDETRPQQVIARMPLNSGRMAVMMGDGSMQMARSSGW